MSCSHPPTLGLVVYMQMGLSVHSCADGALCAFVCRWDSLCIHVQIGQCVHLCADGLFVHLCADEAVCAFVCR